MKIPWWQVDMGESPILSVVDVATKKSYSMGSFCEIFEREIGDFMGTDFAVGVTSGSDALLIALLGLGIKSGDVVLIQDRSWIAAANAVALIGAKPIYVDVCQNSPTLCLNDLKRKYTSKAKALVVVHMNGRHGDIENILDFCKSKKLPVIEDAAQALGSNINGKQLGTFGLIGCFSLSIAKIIGAGQGGFCVSNQEELAVILKEIRIHGTVDTFTAKWNRLGFNFRLTDFHAAIASTQLPKLPQRISKASKVYDLYLNLLSSADFIRVIPIDFANGEVGPYIEGELTTTDRNKFIAYMLHNQVDIRPFYPAICTAKYLNGTGDAPNARRFADNCIYLPSGPDITEDQIEYVCDLILAYPR